MKPLIPYLVVLANLLQLALSEEKIHCGLFSHSYQVQIMNQVPSDSPWLRVHCAAGDAELGYLTLPPNKDFVFSFCSMTLSKTLYFCHVWWGSKDAAFVVFDKRWQEITIVSRSLLQIKDL